MSDAAALVVDEAMIGRASGCDQPTDRQCRIAPHVGDLKFGFRFRDVECPAAEQRLQPVANTERQSPDTDVTIWNRSAFMWARSASDSAALGAAWLQVTAVDQRLTPIAQKSRVRRIQTRTSNSGRGQTDRIVSG